MRRRPVREDEQELWTRFVRGITPLASGGPEKVPPGKTVVTPRQTAARHDAGRPDIPAPPPRRTRVPDRSIPEDTFTAPRSLAMLTPGEMAVALHLRRRIAKRRGTGLREDISIGTRADGIDTGSWKRLSRGQMTVGRRLDLHGMTAQAAFLRMREFLISSHREGIRCVEIVTGLGSGPEGGVLRRELPFWLGRDDLRRLVLGVTHTHSANHGAVRVLLRKPSGKRR